MEEAGSRRLRVSAIALVLALLAFGSYALAAPAARADTQSFPNDPEFAPCESQTTPQDVTSGCNNNEQWNLFGALSTTCGGQPRPDFGLPCWSPAARDPQHAAGVDMTGAWDQGNVGRPDVLVAYIEGGVNYNSDGIKDALDDVYLNQGELPYPQDSSGTDHGTYDLNGDGHFDIRDYAQDPRVNPACPAGISPFSNHQEGVTWSCVPGGQRGHQQLRRRGRVPRLLDRAHQTGRRVPGPARSLGRGDPVRHRPRRHHGQLGGGVLRLQLVQPEGDRLRLQPRRLAGPGLQ